jgi:murein peptide amidase A
MDGVHAESVRAMQRLGLNIGGYRGQATEIGQVLRDLESAAHKAGWSSECILEQEKYCLRTFHRTVKQPRKRIYLSTGIHGDEPAGPVALRDLISGNLWPDDVELFVCPCLNPTGCAAVCRENAEGIDLNRDYRHLRSQEVRAHVQWLDRIPNFDITIILHEDWESNGFYLYELNPDEALSPAEEIITAVSKVCPIESTGLVDGWTAVHGIVRPQADPNDRPQWPETIYLISRKTRQSFTLEAPSDFPLAMRVEALKVAVNTVMSWISPSMQ